MQCVSVDLWSQPGARGAVPPGSALTWGRRRSSRSSWCRERPPSCRTWAGSGGWRQRSHSGKPGPLMARCQCSGRTQSRSRVECRTCEQGRGGGAVRAQYLHVRHFAGLFISHYARRHGKSTTICRPLAAVQTGFLNIGRPKCQDVARGYFVGICCDKKIVKRRLCSHESLRWSVAS